MASAWGSSWGTSWGDSWGTVTDGAAAPVQVTGAWYPTPEERRRAERAERQFERDRKAYERRIEDRAKALEKTIADAYARATGKEVKEDVAAVIAAETPPTTPEAMLALGLKVAETLAEQPKAEIDGASRELISLIKSQLAALSQALEEEAQYQQFLLQDDEDAALVLSLM